MMPDLNREDMGRRVWVVWGKWLWEQSDSSGPFEWSKDLWLTVWDDLPPSQREGAMLIGDELSRISSYGEA